MLADAQISNFGYLWWNRPAIRILHMHYAGAPNEDIVQNLLNIALLNVF